MKQRVKKQNNKRTKAITGIELIPLIAAAISTATSIGTTAYNANEQRKLEAKRRREQLLADNEANAMQNINNIQEALNYDKNEELATLKTNDLSTIDTQASQFKCGGRKRMKRGGGNVTSDLNKLSYYI